MENLLRIIRGFVDKISLKREKKIKINGKIYDEHMYVYFLYSTNLLNIIVKEIKKTIQTYSIVYHWFNTQ